MTYQRDAGDDFPPIEFYRTSPIRYCHEDQAIAAFYRCGSDACQGHIGPQADAIAAALDSDAPLTTGHETRHYPHGPLVAGCPDCNSPEAIDARRRATAARNLRLRVALVIDLDRNEFDAEYGTRETVAEIRDYVENTARDAVSAALAQITGARVRVAERRP